MTLSFINYYLSFKYTMNESEYWKKIEQFFEDNFQTEKNPPIETLLFLIGLQELGSGQQKYTKEDKVNLIHIALGDKAEQLSGQVCARQKRSMMFIPCGCRHSYTRSVPHKRDSFCKQS